MKKTKQDLLKELKQRLEDSWSGFTQVVEELEQFNYSVNDSEETKKLSELTLEDFASEEAIANITLFMSNLAQLGTIMLE